MTSDHRPALLAGLNRFSPPLRWPGVTGFTINATAAHISFNVAVGQLYVGWHQNYRRWKVTHYDGACDWQRTFDTPEKALAEAVMVAARLDSGFPAFVTGPGTECSHPGDTVPSV